MEERQDAGLLRHLIGSRIESISFAGINFTLLMESGNLVNAFSETRLKFKDAPVGRVEDVYFTEKDFVIIATGAEVFICISDDDSVENFLAVVDGRTIDYRHDDNVKS